MAVTDGPPHTPRPPRWQVVCQALRLPFLGASLIPFAYGVALGYGPPQRFLILLAGICVASVHLAANLVNELADAVSGVDARDPTAFGMFGGSKVLQREWLSPHWYRRAILVCLATAALALLAVSWRISSLLPLAVGLLGVIAAVAYSVPPLRLMTRGLGEGTVALLFGPLTVAAGACARTGLLPAWHTVIMGVPLGLLTAAVLLANEVPDAGDDDAVGKRSMVVHVGAEHGWQLYAAVSLLAFLLVGITIVRGWHGPLAAACLLPATLAARATRRLKQSCHAKQELRESSRLAILAQALTGLILIADLLIRTRA